MPQPQARPGQPLTTHLTQVGNDMGHYLTTLNGPTDLAQLTGYLHDLGKFSPKWQDYLTQSSQGTWKHDRIPHAIHGALQAWEDWAEDSQPIAIAMALSIAGHHSGLSNVYGDDGLSAKLDHRTELQELPDKLPPDFDVLLDDTIDRLNQNLPEAHQWLTQGKPLALSLKIRYLFAILVNCDRNDAANCNRLTPQSPPDYPPDTESLETLWQTLNTKINSLTPKSPIDPLRHEFWQECITGHHQPGWISVKGPCGVGKTYSLMGLALTHALQHQKRRIIYCAPFNTILDQTLNVYQDLFGTSVIGHFCTVEPDDPKYHDTFTQQWRHPIVVTSMVQLFQSLFSHRATPTRKLANLTHAVIVLDEIQSIPTAYLSPILNILQELIDHLGCTILLSTATLPNYEKWNITPQPAIAKPQRYYQSLTRVNYHQRNTLTWDTIATEAKQSDRQQVLIGVQTVKAARDAYNAISGTLPVMMLTAKMPPIHRQEVLATIKTKLNAKTKEPIVLVATTCIQAGVDISFPIGYFEQISADGLIQFAGRVNRNGEYGDRGEVNLFKTFDQYNLPPGDLALRQSITATILHLGQDLNDDQAIEEFTRRLFNQINTDEKDIIKMLSPDKLRFRDASDAFNLIAPTIPVLVCPEHHREIFDRAWKTKNWNFLNRFSVGFYPQQIDRSKNLLKPIDSSNPDLGYIWLGAYDFGPIT